MESRHKMSESHKGKVLSESHRQHIREAGLGEKNHNYGQHPSEETRRKLSESHKGTPGCWQLEPNRKCHIMAPKLKRGCRSPRAQPGGG